MPFSCSGFSQDNNSTKSICLWINQTKVLEFSSPPNILLGGGLWVWVVDQVVQWAGMYKWIRKSVYKQAATALHYSQWQLVCKCVPASSWLLTHFLSEITELVNSQFKTTLNMHPQLFVNEAFTQILSLLWQNYGAYLETWGAGIQGSVLIRGLPSGDLDLTSHTWVYQVSCLRGSFLSCPFWICRSTTVITFGAESDHRLRTVVFCDSTKMEHGGNLEESFSVHGSNTCGLWFWMSAFRWD